MDYYTTGNYWEFEFPTIPRQQDNKGIFKDVLRMVNNRPLGNIENSKAKRYMYKGWMDFNKKLTMTSFTFCTSNLDQFIIYTLECHIKFLNNNKNN